MPAVELPNGQSAIIYSKDEISERIARRISRAYMSAASSASKLSEKGFDAENPATWGIFQDVSDDERNAIDGYQAELIAGMVRSWTFGELPTTETALDLARKTFELLAGACGDEFNRTEDFSPDGAIDPKAPTVV